MEQARARTGKGGEAAEAAIEMARLSRSLLPRAKGEGRRAKGEKTEKRFRLETRKH